MNIDSQILSEAIKETELLMKQLANLNGDLSPAYQAIEKAIPIFEQSYPLEALIPSESEIGMGFSQKMDKSGKGFWERYSKAVYKQLCSKNSELNKIVQVATY